MKRIFTTMRHFTTGGRLSKLVPSFLLLHFFSLVCNPLVAQKQRRGVLVGTWDAITSLFKGFRGNFDMAYNPENGKFFRVGHWDDGNADRFQIRLGVSTSYVQLYPKGVPTSTVTVDEKYGGQVVFSEAYLSYGIIKKSTPSKSDPKKYHHEVLGVELTGFHNGIWNWFNNHAGVPDVGSLNPNMPPNPSTSPNNSSSFDKLSKTPNGWSLGIFYNIDKTKVRFAGGRGNFLFDAENDHYIKGNYWCISIGRPILNIRGIPKAIKAVAGASK